MKLAILFLILFISTLSPSSSHARVLEKVYGVVNGEIITLTEIKDYQRKLKNGGFLNDLLFSDPAERQKASESRDYLLKLLVDEKIIDFEVKKNGLLVTEERVAKEISSIAKRQNLSVNQLKQTLTDQGVNFAEYRDFVKKSVERRQLVEKEITSKIKISEQDIVSFYLANNAGGKTQVFEFNIAHILMKKSQKKKAEDVATQLKSGGNFETLVKQHSTDSDTKNDGGKFGTFTSGEMIASIEKAIVDLKIGETSKVVATPMGLHIFKVLDKKLVKDPAIEKQKQAIYQKLFAEQFKEQLNFWLSQKRKDAIIQINKS
jgi:peptidyl-prolyl cis-trans isomerase SurA